MTLYRQNTSNYGSAYLFHFESNDTFAESINEYSPAVASSAVSLSAFQAGRKKLATKHTGSLSRNEGKAGVNAIDTIAVIGAATTIREGCKAILTLIGRVKEVRLRTGSAVVLP